MGQTPLSTRGFTLLELLIAMLVLGTLLATAMLILPSVVTAAKADSGSSQITALLRAARERSITERRNIEIRFVGANGVEAWRDDVDAGGLTIDQTLVQETMLEQGMEYERFITVPDTPDGFSEGFEVIAFTGDPPWRFTTEGTLVDANGDVVNGTVFLGQPQRPETARAVSLFGPTALLREWRWNGSGWVE